MGKSQNAGRYTAIKGRCLQKKKKKKEPNSHMALAFRLFSSYYRSSYGLLASETSNGGWTAGLSSSCGTLERIIVPSISNPSGLAGMPSSGLWLRLRWKYQAPTASRRTAATGPATAPAIQALLEEGFSSLLSAVESVGSVGVGVGGGDAAVLDGEVGDDDDSVEVDGGEVVMKSNDRSKIYGYISIWVHCSVSFPGIILFFLLAQRMIYLQGSFDK